jgi:hypothetical protein
VTLEVEGLDRLYLNGYIGSLATAGGLVYFMESSWASLSLRPWCLASHREVP